MDAEAQANIKKIAEGQEDKGSVIVVLGASDIDGAEISAETVTIGDPSYSGPLAGVSLGLPVYHVLEDDIASQANPDVYEEQVGVMKLALDTDAIVSTMLRIRESAD